MPRQIPNVRKVATLRANALGDLIFALPALRALRTAYPSAELVYIGKSWHQDFIPGRVREIDRVVVAPPYAGVSEAEDFMPSAEDKEQINAFFAAMRAERFDIALQLHGGGRHSNPFVNGLGARLSVGAASPDAARLDRTVPYRYYQPEALRYLEIVSRIGATTQGLAPRLTVLAKDRREAATVRQAAGVVRPYIVLHPGASDVRRRWGTRKFTAVANHFLNRGYAVAVTGVPSEGLLVDRIVAGTGGQAAGFCGSLSLGGLAALLADAALVVSNDTGPLHLAEAVGTPTVGIYWVGNAILAAPSTRTHHMLELSWVLNCRICGVSIIDKALGKAGSCTHQVSFVNAIPIRTVINDCSQLLRLSPRPQRATLHHAVA